MDFCNLIQCPVCQKTILPDDIEMPEEYEEFFYFDDDGTETIDEESPVQRGWSMSVSFRVGVFGFITVTPSEETFAPLTLVCSYHPLLARPSEELKQLAPWIVQVPQREWILSSSDVQEISTNVLPKIEGDHSIDVKLLWLWVNMQEEQEAE